MPGSGEDLVWRALFDDNAIGHEDDAVGDLAREPHLMGHDDHRHSLRRQRPHDTQHVADKLRIQS